MKKLSLLLLVAVLTTAGVMSAMSGQKTERDVQKGQLPKGAGLENTGFGSFIVYAGGRREPLSRSQYDDMLAQISKSGRMVQEQTATGFVIRELTPVEFQAEQDIKAGRLPKGYRVEQTSTGVALVIPQGFNLHIDVDLADILTGKKQLPQGARIKQTSTGWVVVYPKGPKIDGKNK
ncbi:MAG: hypothetical protein UU47_C0019G0002 [candidate division TM6 bacterium GW2011_GWE2_41_16]|nr:MAG: hypothetical protein UU47_C0019G0002 [candidate division TM6 bacterium GW2011_GWE2_41_16]